MANVYFIGDLHFGHTNIVNFRPFGTEELHTQHLMDCWTDTVTKRDVVYVMGDAAFTQSGLDLIGTLAGKKVLIRGNHDLLPTDNYASVFEEVYGLLAWHGLWLSHAPIHPQELYGRSNIHGHCHRGGPQDIVVTTDSSRGHQIGSKATYFNTCAEHLPVPYVPISLDDIREKISERIRRGG